MGAGVKPPTTSEEIRRVPGAEERREAPHGECALLHAPHAAVPKRRVRMPIIPCTGGDHFALNLFLTDVFGRDYAPCFQAALEEPAYKPGDRLLLRRTGRIIAHAHVARRAMQFGAIALPAAALDGLAVEEDCRSQGLATHLLTAAERQMVRSGALVGLLRTRIPQFFDRSGWAVCGGGVRGAANPHAVLAQLLDQGVGLRRHNRIQVRPWRRWEEDAVARVYRQNLLGSFGALERSRGYWHWLLERRAFDQFYVALDGPDLWDFKETSTQVVGYAAIGGETIVEFLTLPGRKKAAAELLARICGDAIEHDHRQIRLQAAAGSYVQDYFHAAPQHPPHAPCRHADVCMARILDPAGFLRKLCGLFGDRAAEAGLARPLELGLLIDGQKYQIDIAGSGRVTEDTLGRSYLSMNAADFTCLVLGQLDWQSALSEGRIEPSTALAEEAGRVLFPALPFWRPLLDDLAT